MPYLYSTHKGESLKKQAISKPPFGPGFTEEQAENADRMEVWATSFNDPGEYTEFRLIKGEQVIDRRRIGGF